MENHDGVKAMTGNGFPQEKITITRRFSLIVALIVMSHSSTLQKKWLHFGTQSVYAESVKEPMAPIYLMVSILWEGAHLKPHNIIALKNFRQQFSGISVFHFLNPGYFTKPGADPKKINTLIRSTFRPNDQHGLRVVPWKSLVEQAGIRFKTFPTFWGNQLTLDQCHSDCGLEVPLTAYTKNEMTQIVDFSIKTLSTHGYSKAQGFLANGWLINTDLLEVLLEAGIQYDFSAVDPLLMARRLSRFPIMNWLTNQWQDIPAQVQPHIIQTKNADITEVGNSAAIVDYLGTEEIVDLFRSYIQAQKNNKQKAFSFHIGIMQETAYQYLPRLRKALIKIFAISKEENINLKPLTLPGESQTVAQETMRSNKKSFAH